MRGRVEMPRFLGDLYADLRDRHLLIPLAAIVAAIVAVPLLLGGSSPAPSPAPSAAVKRPAAATAVEPAVAVEQLAGIRNYRKRLAELKRKNPFEQQYEIKTKDTSVEVAEVGTSATSDPSVSVAGSDGTTSTTSATDTSTSSGSSSPAVSVASDSASGGSATVEPLQPSEPTVEEMLITYRVDVSVGLAGALEERDDVRKFDPLPRRSTPILTYVGVTEDAKRAAFLVSTAVTETDGEGRCVRSEPGRCDLVMMKPGEQRDFVYGASGKRLRLKLREIVAVSKPAKD